MDQKKISVVYHDGYANRAERFINKKMPPSLRLPVHGVLFILSLLYSAIIHIRYALYRLRILTIHRVAVPVISVGNITAGGTGKTPFTIAVANHFARTGKKVSVISRGYKRNIDTPIRVVSDGMNISADVAGAGDEPYLIAGKCPGVSVIVGSDRWQAAIESIRRFNPDLLILDDGYQHLSLHRDINILLLDSKSPFSNGYVLPFGYLREPVHAVDRADHIIRVCKSPDTPVTCQTIGSIHQPVSYFSYEPHSLVNCDLEHVSGIDEYRDKTMILFCGIGNPEPFIEWAQSSGLRIPEIMVFDDHHTYTGKDARILVDAMDRHNAHVLLTTEKDIVKIAPLNWNMDIVAVAMELKPVQTAVGIDIFQSLESILFSNGQNQ